MDSLETKKLALIRILQILQKHSDFDHRLTQKEIASYLKKDYGIVLERKAIGRNLALLKEADFEIETGRDGSYLKFNEFDDSELRLLIDSVLCSQHVNSHQTSDLIEKLCSLSNKYFRSHVKNIRSVEDWNKTENPSLFFNIETVDLAIEEGKQIQYDYNKYGVDKKLHKSSFQRVTPYQLILHNQKYYLMAHSSYWDNMVFHRLERISNIQICDKPAKPIREIPGYEGGIDYKRLSSTMPYMYTDRPERIKIKTRENVIDQIIDWFGKDVSIAKGDAEGEIIVSLYASPSAMEHWALQYLNLVEILAPQHLREKIKLSLENGLKKY